MDFNKVKLVICDIDNTLLTMENRQLSPKNMEAVYELHRRGIYFGLASGRDIKDIYPYYEKWGFKEQFDLIVCMNGAQIYDKSTNETQSFNIMTKDMYERVLKIMDPFDYTYSLFVADSNIYHERIDEAIAASMRRAGMTEPLMIGDRIDEIVEKGIYKFLYRVPAEKMADLEAYVAKQDLGNVKGFKTQTTCYEFTDARNSKAFGMQKFCQAHGISMDEVLAFGDTSNDNEMLAACYGVCLLNGSDDTKACAKEITRKTCGEDGFADFLDTHLFNK